MTSGRSRFINGGRRSFLTRTLTAGAALGIAPMLNRNVFRVFAADDTGYSRRTLDLVSDSFVMDMLAPLTVDSLEWRRWTVEAAGMTAEDLARFRVSGLKALHHSPGIGGPDAYTDCLKFLAELNGLLTRHATGFRRISRPADLTPDPAGRLGVIIGVQNSMHFRQAEDVAYFHQLGQRVSQLTYNKQNLLGAGSTEREDGGVSDFGYEIIQAMNQVGMLIDVSHCGNRTTLDAIELSKTPVAITHANCRALNDHPRLKSDEAIRKLAAKGGVMGITGVRQFVTHSEPTTLENIVDHIDHVARLVGVEHVGIGSDASLTGYDRLPPAQLAAMRSGYKSSYAFRDKLDVEGFDHPRKIFDLTEALLRRGYSDAHVRAILGGNFARLLGAVWK